MKILFIFTISFAFEIANIGIEEASCLTIRGNTVLTDYVPSRKSLIYHGPFKEFNLTVQHASLTICQSFQSMREVNFIWTWKPSVDVPILCKYWNHVKGELKITNKIWLAQRFR